MGLGQNSNAFREIQVGQPHDDVYRVITTPREEKVILIVR